MAGEEELKNVKLPLGLWEELSKDKIDLRADKLSDVVRFWKDKAQDKKDNVAVFDEKDKKITDLGVQLSAAEDRILELEKQMQEARALQDKIKFLEEQLNDARKELKDLSVVQVVDVPESLKEQIEQMIIEKYGEAADRNEEALKAWAIWLKDYAEAKKNFAKVRERARDRSEIEVGFDYDKAILAALIRHGFIKRLEFNRYQLLK